MNLRQMSDAARELNALEYRTGNPAERQRQAENLAADYRKIQAAHPKTAERLGMQGWVDGQGRRHVRELDTGAEYMLDDAASSGRCHVPGCTIDHSAAASYPETATRQAQQPVQGHRAAMAGQPERLVGGLPGRQRWPGY